MFYYYRICYDIDLNNLFDLIWNVIYLSKKLIRINGISPSKAHDKEDAVWCVISRAILIINILTGQKTFILNACFQIILLSSYETRRLNLTPILKVFKSHENETWYILNLGRLHLDDMMTLKVWPEDGFDAIQKWTWYHFVPHLLNFSWLYLLKGTFDVLFSSHHFLPFNDKCCVSP